MNLSNRIKAMQFSPIRKLSTYADDARSRGLKVIGLNIGQPDIETPEVFFKALKKFDSKVVAYCDSKGTSPLIESMLKYYNRLGYELEQDNLLITSGGSEALMFTLLTICDIGDEIIIPEPFYTNYNGFSDIASVKVRPFRTYAENGFSLPKREEIEEKITEKTKAILISNPGNPTGAVYSRDELSKLVDIALKYYFFI